MKQDNRALLYGLGAVAGWSTVATAFKLALEVLNPVQLVFWATLTATTILFVTTTIKSGLSALPKSFMHQPLLSFSAGLLNPVIYYLLLFAAYDALPAQVAMSINYSWAIVLTFMAAIFLKQAITAADYFAGLICYLGVILIVTGGSLEAFGESHWVGVGLALASTVIWATYWSMAIKDDREPLVGLTINFLIALPVTALICFLISDFGISAKGLMAAGYVGLIEMALGFVMWSTALKLSSNASRVSNLIFLSPIISLLLIAGVLGEAIQVTTVLGLALILGGLLGQQWAHARNNRRD